MDKSKISFYILFGILTLAAIFLCFTSLAREISLDSDDTILLQGAMTPESVKKVISEIKEIKRLNHQKEINLIIKSPGGSVNSMFELARYINSEDNILLITLEAASCAAFLPFLTSHPSLVVEGAYVMFHAVYHQVPSPIVRMNDVEEIFRTLKEINNYLFEKVEERLINKEVLRNADSIDVEFFINEEHIKAGLFSEMVSIKCTPSLIAAEEEVDVSIGMMRGKVIKSKCPLIP